MTAVTDFDPASSHNQDMNTPIMPFTPEQTVGEIAAQFPAAVRVFEKYGIDFCCGGKLPVATVCASRSLDAGRLLEEVGQALETPGPDGTDWFTAPIPQLVDHILDTHHQYMKKQLPVVAARLAKVLNAHGERHGEMLRRMSGIYAAMKEELDGHLLKEEMVLFPLVKALAGGAPGGSFHCGSVKNPIRVMWMEHESAGEALRELRELTAGYTLPEDACNTFRILYFELEDMERDLHRHIHLENNILFPRAIKLENQ
ncbi:MAG: iron-sulfur cluster repair di-iron protein [Candidatus Solibacter sp.]